MSAPEVYTIAQTPITSHAFSPDRKRESCPPALRCALPDRPAEVAVSLNSNDVAIYTKRGSEWTPTETLAEVRAAAHRSARRA
jgi:actin related protein 2/3 complex subunit 1A/1B